jgi:oxygen-independent coproporphyrinogen-3 oxidase
MVEALVAELGFRHGELNGQLIETIYIGGGTPSLLERPQLDRILDRVNALFSVKPGAEVTLEANPDDLDENKASDLKAIGVNRLSLGIQSFHDTDLQFMNRAHTAAQAVAALDVSLRHFNNTTIDLIFGTPTMSNEGWSQNLSQAIASGVPHISAYALTVEERTALHRMIKKAKVAGPDDWQTAEQFEIAMDTLGEAGYDHYEISNYSKPGYSSAHNGSYWNRTPYLGLGPSAHSFVDNTRSWNVSNNAEYLRRMQGGSAIAGSEVLSLSDRAHEMIMTGLRTGDGLVLDSVKPLLSDNQFDALLAELVMLRAGGLVRVESNRTMLTRQGKLLADGIISRLFV